MHPDILVTLVFGGFVALSALLTGIAILRGRLHGRTPGAEGEEQQHVASVH